MLDKNVPDEELGKFPTLIKIVETLRSPGGCPWDIEQTHKSQSIYDIEVPFPVCFMVGNEVVGVSEELSSLADMHVKLIRRHPHVFGDVQLEDAKEVELNWEQLKKKEREEQGITQSPVDGIPKDLPALVYSQLMQDRTAKSGFEWEDIRGVLSKIEEECKELTEAVNEQESIHEMGDLLLVMVNLCRWMNIQAEDALRQANARFSLRYIRMEELALASGKIFSNLPLAEKEEFWQQAKLLEQ